MIATSAGRVTVADTEPAFVMPHCCITPRILVALAIIDDVSMGREWDIPSTVADRVRCIPELLLKTDAGTDMSVSSRNSSPPPMPVGAATILKIPIAGPDDGARVQIACLLRMEVYEEVAEMKGNEGAE